MTHAEDETRRRLRMPSGPNPLGGEEWTITRTVKQVEHEPITDPMEIYGLIADEI